MVNSLIALVQEDSSWAPFTALSDVDLGLLVSARKLDLPKPIWLTDSGKNFKKSVSTVVICSTGVNGTHIVK